MESWQDEIIKAQISQEIGVEMSMENSDISVFLKSFKENLLSAVDRDSFDKSWSSDLQKRFPNGSWKTVNGARVFINNGKVIAGLDGFNGEIDKFFDGRRKKESGKSGGKKEVKSNVPKEFAHELENYKKATGDKKAAMRKTLLGNANIKDEGLTEAQKEIKQRSIDILKESGESHKEPQEEHEPEVKLSDREQGLLDAYNKDKKAFLKKNTESLRRLGVEDVTIGYSDHESKPILIKGKTNKGEDVQALVMPIMVKDESEVLTLK